MLRQFRGVGVLFLLRLRHSDSRLILHSACWNESYPVEWHALPLLSSQLTCWYGAVFQVSPVAVVSALCLDVVCWIVVPSSLSCMLVPMVLWALVRCGMQSAVSGFGDVTDDGVWSSLCSNLSSW